MRAAARSEPRPRGEGVVTALVAKRGRSDRLVVYIDGARAFELASAVAERAGLRVGDVASEDAQGRLLEEDAPYRARERALAWLAVRDRSCQETAERLRAAGFSPEVIVGTVDWLRELGYVDDARFAAGYVSVKTRSGWGARRIRSELLRKGVDRTLVDEALHEIISDAERTGEGLETVMTLARRRFGGQFERDPEGAARRLAGFLGRRGYDWDTINLVTRVLSGESTGEGRVPLS